MTTKEMMNSPQLTARVAGFLYLAFFVTFFLAENGVHVTPVGPIDAAAIVQNIQTSERLFRIGFISFLNSAMFFLLSAWALYALLKPVNKDYALLLVLLNLGGVAIKCISLLCEYAALLLLSGADYPVAFQADQQQALAILFLNLYKNGFMISQIFFGLWLLPLGYLVLKSGYLPRFLGILLIIDCFAILAWFFQFFLFPGLEAFSYVCLTVSFIAEASLCLWLIVKGINLERWRKFVLETA